MADDKLGIQLLLGNRTHSITVKREEEEFFRAAAKMINDKLNRYRKAYPNKENEEYMSVVLLDIAVSLVKNKGNNDTEPYVAALSKLEEEVMEALRASTAALNQKS